MMRKSTIVFLTGNEGKLAEARAILAPVEIEGRKVDLPEIQEVDPKKIIEVKLLEAQKLYPGEQLIVDDTSLSLDCLKGLPGPLVKWFGNEMLVKISEKMGNNKARAIVWIGYMDTGGKISFYEGVVEGKIVRPRGKNGFGWDSVFMPDGFEKTYAEMTMDEKNGISMRKMALEKLKASILERDRKPGR